MQSFTHRIHPFILDMFYVNQIFSGPFWLLVTIRRGVTTAVVGVISRRNGVSENSEESEGLFGPNSAVSWLFCLWTLFSQCPRLSPFPQRKELKIHLYLYHSEPRPNWRRPSVFCLFFECIFLPAVFCEEQTEGQGCRRLSFALR